MMKSSQDSNHTLIIKVKSGSFTKDNDWIGKMDPFVRIKIGNEIQRTETAKDQGKTPKWTTALTYKITPEQYDLADNVGITLEAFDEDSSTSAEFLGRVTYKLSQLKAKPKESVTLNILNEKNKQTGTIDVEFDFKVVAPVINPKPGQETSPTKTTQQTTPENQSAPAAKLIGTVMIRPGDGKFEAGGANKQTLKLAFLHYGITCETAITERQDSRLLFHNPIIFQLYENEEISVRCIDNDPKKPGVIGEGQINLAELIKRGTLHKIAVTMNSRIKKLGDLNLEVEFFGEIFENPVKVFPPMSVKKGESLHKKVKYTNLDKVTKSIRIKTQNKNLVDVKTETLTIAPNQVGEIRFEVFAPTGQKTQDEKCRVDVIADDTRAIEESMIFNIRAI